MGSFAAPAAGKLDIMSGYIYRNGRNYALREIELETELEDDGLTQESVQFSVEATGGFRMDVEGKVVPHEQLMDATMELAEKIPAKPPIAVRLAIEGIRRGLDWPMEEYMRYHALASPFCAETEDHKQGALAFLEKRRPVFKGK